MICLGEKRDGVHVLHVIIGPETEMHFNMSGQSILDISEYVKEAKEGEKCIIVVNRCESEEELLQMMASERARSQMQSMMNQLSQQMNQQLNNETNDKNKSTKTEQPSSGINCPKCRNPNSAIIKDGNVYQCSSCQKIEEGLVTKNIPPIPSQEELDKLREDIVGENKEQKKSFFRFTRNKKSKDKPVPPITNEDDTHEIQ